MHPLFALILKASLIAALLLHPSTPELGKPQCHVGVVCPIPPHCVILCSGN